MAYDIDGGGLSWWFTSWTVGLGVQCSVRSQQKKMLGFRFKRIGGEGGGVVGGESADLNFLHNVGHLIFLGSVQQAC